MDSGGYNIYHMLSRRRKGLKIQKKAEKKASSVREYKIVYTYKSIKVYTKESIRVWVYL